MSVTKKQVKIMISWIAAILWMLLIFYLSSQTADSSNAVSTGITTAILDLIERVFPGLELELEGFNHIVRKFAHFFAYLVLGTLVLNAHIVSGIKSKKAILSSLAICVLYAISDETHQALVPGRGPQIRDVVIDSAGALAGAVIYSITSIRVNNKIG